MKNITFAISFSAIFFFGCTPKYTPVCVTGQQYTDEGMKSELISIKTIGIMDTTLSFLNTKVAYCNTINGKFNKEIGIGMTVRISKTGSKKLEIGGITNSQGNYNTFLEKGNYDIEFLWTGSNPLLLRNFEIQSGEIKLVEVMLGNQGKVVKKYEINLK
jgi:hypothetical protein